MSSTLHLRDINTVIDETGMSRERILELRAMRLPARAHFNLAADWMEANALDPAVSLEFCHRIVERLGPKTGHRRHDLGTGPIAGIAGGLSVETIRSGHGPCQHCDQVGPLRLVGDRWLCDHDGRRHESRLRFRAMVKAA